MGYTTILFLFFVFAVAVLYFSFPPKIRWVVLLVASYVFYWISSNWAIIYIVVTTATTFYAGRLIGEVNICFNKEKNELSIDERKKRKIVDTKKKKKFLAGTLLINFGILAVLKYGEFIGSNINILLGFLQIGAIPVASFILPVGISFYTFQSMGYLIDVYRGKYDPDKNILKFALFVAFFPQIVQGPIGRYDVLANQLYAENRFEYNRVKDGILLMVYGFAKKLIIADRALVLVQNVFDNRMFAEYGSIVFLGAVVYGVQIYCDFSGGIDISRGVAQILGINMAENFRRPYYAQSIAEYWRRWHMTLGAWMREYLFYPILLSKPLQNLTKRIRDKHGIKWAKIIPTAIVSFIVFIVVGIWHGPYWKRVAYGLWNGTIITSSIIFEPLYQKTHAFFHIRTDCFSYRMFTRARTFILVTFARYFSRSPSLRSALANIKTTVTNFYPKKLFDGTVLQLGIVKADYLIILTGVAVLILFGIMQEKGQGIRKTLSEQNIWFRWVVYAAIIIIFMLFPVESQMVVKEFIYAQF